MEGNSDEPTGGPKQSDTHKDLTFWFQGTVEGGYQKPWLVGALGLRWPFLALV